MPERVLLGRITGAHGIRGEVVITTYTETPDSLMAYGALSDAEGRRQFVVRSVRAASKGIVARIEGVEDRTQAEALKGTELTVGRDRLPEPPEQEFYHSDLIGMAVEDPAGQPLGTVVAVQNFGAGDLLELRMLDRPETEFIPFTSLFVPEVDLAARRLVVVIPTLVEEPSSAEGGATALTDEDPA